PSQPARPGTSDRGNPLPRLSGEFSPRLKGVALILSWSLTGHDTRACHRCGWDQPHALLHLARHIIAAHDCAAVAQATCLSLHHEHPERVAGLQHEIAPRLVRPTPSRCD